MSNKRRKNFYEQIDYGSRPERMDPNLERKLADPEGLYAKNPAMRKGESDVQRLVSNRFQKVAQKLSDVTGIQDLSASHVQQMIYMEMLSKVPGIIMIESRHKRELEDLAKEICIEETEIGDNWFQIDARLNRESIDVSNFRINPEDVDDEEQNDEYDGEDDGEDDGKDKPAMPEFPSFDVMDLTHKEIIELEKHKRNIINAIIQGAAKKGHYLFQKPEIKRRLDEINPSLYRDYLGIMAINDFMYFSMEQMIEMMSETGQGVAGKVELSDADDDEGGGFDGEETPDTKITAQGLIFPILCHEIIKGIEEAKGRHGLPQDPAVREKVLAQTDTLSNEPMQLRIGPEIVEKIRFALPDDIFDPENKGLINWFHISLYQLPAEEFLQIIGNAISEDQKRVSKAKDAFKEIMKEAMTLKNDFEQYEESSSETGREDDDDDDEEDIDDFLSGLGIVRPD